jgi:hypothetical protein
MVAGDTLDEGEPTPVVNEYNNNNNIVINAPSVQAIPPPSTPPRPSARPITPPAPRVTRMRQPVGYYTKLVNGEAGKGETASVAIETLMEASEMDLLDKTTHLEWALAVAEPEPSLHQALNRPDATEWQEVLDYEISQLEKLGTWELADAPKGANIIPCHFMLATKRGPDGKKLKLWVQLVANGQHQQYGVDYFDMFTPMANMSTIHTVLAMAAQRDWEIHQVDIKSAYLYASIQEEIYMRAPPGYLKDSQRGKVLRLRRSLPGLKS